MRNVSHRPSRRPSLTLVRLLVFALATVATAGCGPDAAAPMTQPARAAATAEPAQPDSSTTVPSETVWPHARQLAEHLGVTPEEAQDMLLAQARQTEGLIALEDLIEPDLVVEAAFSTDSPIDELTIYVVDVGAVAKVSQQLNAAGLDPTRTLVEVFMEDERDYLDKYLEMAGLDDYDWLMSPGPDMLGAWKLADSNGEAPTDPITVAFVPTEWESLECGDLGRYLTSADQTVWMGLDPDASECGQATDQLRRLLTEPVAANSGRFEVSFDDQTMSWLGADGTTLTWQRHESEDPHRPVPASAQTAWMESPAPDMEGVWNLVRIGSDDPAAPATLTVGVSIWEVGGLCNQFGGLYAITAEGTAAFLLEHALKGCFGPEMALEEQLIAVFQSNRSLFTVSVEGNTMTWTGTEESELIWERTKP